MVDLNDILNPKSNESKFAKFYMIPLDPDTGNRLTEERPEDLPSMRLQYWPESLDYSRGDIGWEEQSIPGSSHPLQGWTGNGAPTLSFEAIFTTDVDPGYTPDDSIANVVGDAVNSFLDPNRGHNAGVDVNAAVAWFAGCSNPIYSEHGQPVKPPPVIQVVPSLLSPNELNGFDDREVDGAKISSSRRGVILSQLPSRDFYGVLSDFSADYQAFFPSGAPKIATVSVTLTEVIQIGDVILPHDRMENTKIAKSYRFSGSSPSGRGEVIDRS